MISFIRPIGVHRDINELEYISALLQSHPHVIRSSGSIKAVDIVVYLKSRQGLIVTEEVIDQYIITELAGQIQNDIQSKPSIDDNNDVVTEKKKKVTSKERKAIEESLRIPLDICQLTSILLIPELLEESESMNLKIFSFFRETVEASMMDGVITKSSLRTLFESVNECNVSDEVINEMLELTNRPDGLVEALVSDLHVYKEHEDVSNAPNLVQALSNPSTAKSLDPTKPVTASTTAEVSARSVYTARFIDLSSDTFRRPLFGMQLWTAGIAAYFAYVLNVEGDWVHTKCDNDSYSCQVAKGITSWLNIFLQIAALGLPYIVLGSIGNANIKKIYLLPATLISIATVLLVTVYTYFNKVETEVFTTTGNKDVSGAEYFCEDDDLECIENCRLQPETCTKEYEVLSDYYGISYFLAIALGLLILATQSVDIILMFLPQCWLDGNGLVQRLLLPGTLRQERAGKEAASVRMKHMLQNALDIIYDKLLSSVSNNSDGFPKQDRKTTVLERFLLLPIKTENVGGVLWAWKRVWNGTIFTEEGIWLHGRLLACNFAQCTVFGVMVYFALVFFNNQQKYFYSEEELDYKEYIKKSSEVLYGNYTSFLGDDYYNFLNCTETIMEVDLSSKGGIAIDYTQPWNFILYIRTNYTSYEDAKVALNSCFEMFPTVSKFLDDSNNALSYTSDKLKDLIAKTDVTPEQYGLAALLGLVGGFLTVLYIAAILIPSYISTVMKYRSGINVTLTNPEFLRYRCSMDSVTVLLGSAFWGCFFTATGAMLFVIGLILFIRIIPLILGSVIGFFLILAIRMSILMVLRCAFFSAFYRKNPGAANIMFTVLEVWNVALTLGFVFIRAINLMLVSILYIARIDTPFLATGVGRFGSMELDTISITFVKDLLIHEAHRHMLIERFGLLCLIKLYAGNKFGTRAGSAWRLLFVLITMPWLRKYRLDRNTIALEEEIEQLQDDIEEETDLWQRSEQVLKMKGLESEKALINADRDAIDETDILRKRIEYLEEEVNFLKQRNLDPLSETISEDSNSHL